MKMIFFALCILVSTTSWAAQSVEVDLTKDTANLIFGALRRPNRGGVFESVSFKTRDDDSFRVSCRSWFNSSPSCELTFKIDGSNRSKIIATSEKIVADLSIGDSARFYRRLNIGTTRDEQSSLEKQLKSADGQLVIKCVEELPICKIKLNLK